MDRREVGSQCFADSSWVEEEAGGRSRVVSCLCVLRLGDRDPRLQWPGSARVLRCAPAASGTGGTPHHLQLPGGLQVLLCEYQDGYHLAPISWHSDRADQAKIAYSPLKASYVLTLQKCHLCLNSATTAQSPFSFLVQALIILRGKGDHDVPRHGRYTRSPCPQKEISGDS